MNLDSLLSRAIVPESFALKLTLTKIFNPNRILLNDFLLCYEKKSLKKLQTLLATSKPRYQLSSNGIESFFKRQNSY